MPSQATLTRPIEVERIPSKRGQPNPKNFLFTDTVKNSPGRRGLWLRLKNNTVPDPIHLILLNSALQRPQGPSGVLNIGSFKTQVRLAADFLDLHKTSLPSLTPGTDLLAGVDWLGYGYRPFGTIINSDWASRENLFQFPAWDNFSFNGKAYTKPSIVTALDENKADVIKIDQHSVKDTITEIYEKLTAGADWGLFKGEFEVSYAQALARHWEYRSGAVQMTLRMLRLTLPDSMQQYLAPGFAAALAVAAEDALATTDRRTPDRRKRPQRTDFNNFFDTWGTHYISGIHVGGTYNFYLKFESSSYSSTQEIEAKVSALYKGLSLGDETKISQAMDTLDERGEVFLTAYGGVDVPTDWTDLAQWQIAVRANPACTSFYGDQMQGLTPIYSLVADASRRQALKAQWESYCLRKKLVLPGVGTVVTALQIGCDDHESDAMAQASAGGFSVIPVDMNEGAGGPFIFVAEKFGDGATNDPLLDLLAVTGSATVGPPAGYNKYGTDLNKGVGGDFIYLCSTSNPSGRELQLPIRNVSAESYDQPKNAEFFTQRGMVAISEVGSATPLDMNRNAHGKYVYLTFTRRY